MWQPMSDYQVHELLPELRRSGLGLGEFARLKNVHRRALAEGIKECDPAAYAELAASGVIGNQGDAKKTGVKLETSAKQMLERRGYFVVKAYGSHGIADLVALRADTPPLLVQAKKDGKLGPDEWNQLVQAATQAGAWPVLVRRPEETPTKGALWFRLISERPKGSRLAEYLEPFDPRDPEQATILAPPLAAAS